MRIMKKLARGLGILLLALLLTLVTGWAAMVMHYHLPGEYLRLLAPWLFAAVTLAAFAFLPRRRRTACWFLAVFAVIIVWWLSILPSHDRVWQTDVAVMPYATVDGDHVTIHDIRNNRYRSGVDFDPCYYDKSFDLKKLDSVDLIANYWMGDAIAHIMISFGFGGQDYVTFSIETRKEQSEAYSPVKGFFKQYELIYVVADERDLVLLRTMYRNPREDVYLYRIRMDRGQAQKFFLEYIAQINRLKQKPEWYNTLTTNCTINIVRHLRAFGAPVHYHWKVLFSGYVPQYAYEIGVLATQVPFAELRQQSHINVRANAIGNVPEFSRQIRQGLPVRK